LPRDLRPQLWREVPAAVKGEVLLEAHRAVRQQLIDSSDEKELLAALATLQMDELADLDADLPVSVLDAMVQAMDAQRRERYDAVRAYPDDTAGGLMDADDAAVRADVTLKAVLRYLRQLRKRQGVLPEHLDISLRSKTTVGEAMAAGMPAIPVFTPATKVARLFADQDLISAPVVSEAGRLLGHITIDDVVDVMQDEAEREVMSRVGLSEATDMFAPIIPSAGRRAVWLGAT
jgi:magnesium transporter